jgi:hypothetical protein
VLSEAITIEQGEYGRKKDKETLGGGGGGEGNSFGEVELKNKREREDRHTRAIRYVVFSFCL